MKQFMALLKREFLEWKLVILWTIGVFSFLLLLTLIPINRLDIEALTSFRNEMGEELYKGSFGDLSQKISQNSLTIIKPFSLGVLAGFSAIQFLVMFIGLFYFTDSLFKERSNDSTLYFRSLPVNDHMIILSKIKAGSIGVISMTLILLLIMFIYIRTAVVMVSGEIWGIIITLLNQINMFDLFFDLILYQIVALIWISPLILFMIFLSATVRNRPLIMGIGIPILLGITLQVIFGENAYVTQIVDVFEAIPTMLKSQYLLANLEQVSSTDISILGSFWGDLFSIRTLGSLAVSGLIYFATWKMYRKNISTN
jgi:hypothetical protein